MTAETKVAKRTKGKKRNLSLDTLRTSGEAVEKTPQEKLQNRARRVAVSKPLSSSLSFVTTDSKMKKQYNRTFFQCGQQMVQADGKITSWWCGYRWCVSCAVHRVARMYSAYGDEISNWDQKYFVTLTAPNVSGVSLRGELQRYGKLWRACYKQIRKQGIEFVAVRSVEVTYNEKRDDFHPHMHCIVKGEIAARALIEHWMKRNPDASAAAQDLREADDGSIQEVFKYAAKLTIRRKGAIDPIPPNKLDIIYQAMSGLRMWSAVGIKSALKVQMDDEKLELHSGQVAFKRVSEFVGWEWVQAIRDWVDLDTGEVLSEYIPSERAETFIKKLEGLYG
jgi:hypothetical protein